MLRTQAKILRDLAGLSANGFHKYKSLRQRMLELAQSCDELADAREQALAGGALKASDES